MTSIILKCSPMLAAKLWPAEFVAAEADWDYPVDAYRAAAVVKSNPQKNILVVAGIAFPVKIDPDAWRSK